MGPLINSMRLRFGSAPRISAESIDVTPVTVFVGPNNSGKSKALTEIRDYCNSGQKKSTDVILESLELVGLGTQLACNAIEDLKLTPNPGEAVMADNIIVRARRERHQLPLETLLSCIENPSRNLGVFCRWFLRFRTLLLDGRSRIDLVNPQGGGDLQSSPSNSLQVLFRDDLKRHEVRRIVKQAFGFWFVIDPTGLGQLRIRFSSRSPETDLEERGIHKEAVEFHANATPVTEVSDGVRHSRELSWSLLPAILKSY